MNIFWDYESLTNEEKRRENKKLIKKYPFLLPRHVWTDKEIEDYDYSWTLLDDFPRGWRIAFGEMFLNELKEELIRVNYLDDFRISQIKEKYGSLRFYYNGVPKDSKITRIVDKYEVLSENICINCGKPNVPLVYDSWISPWCTKCWERIELNYWKDEKPYEEIVKNARENYNELARGNSEMSKELKWTTFKEGSKTEHKIDISDTVNEINKNWEKYQKHCEETYDRTI